MADKQIWLITGASRGMGVDFAKAALAAGHGAVATGRNTAAVTDAVGRRTTCSWRSWTSPAIPTPKRPSRQRSIDSAASTWW